MCFLGRNDKKAGNQGEDSNKVDEADQEEAEISGSITCELKQRYELRSHMDSVRGTQFMPAVDALATVSEDCMVKLWNLTELERKASESGASLEPYLTLRGHTGPLFAIAGSTNPNSACKNMLFTGGIEGVIRVWSLPK